MGNRAHVPHKSGVACFRTSWRTVYYRRPYKETGQGRSFRIDYNFKSNPIQRRWKKDKGIDAIFTFKQN